MFIHTVDAPVKIIEMVSKTDATSGGEVEKAPKLLRTGEAGVIRLQPMQAVVVEKTSDIPQMSRFALREAGITVAAGIVTDISYGD
jgi:elongation factor 1-alpha